MSDRLPSAGAAPDGDDDRTRIRPSQPASRSVPIPSTATAPTADNAGLPIGTTLAEFEITRLVGEGGFGMVYEAYDHTLQRRVALKEYMPSSLASRSASHHVTVKSERHRETFEVGLKSFVNEARLLASFDHPSLIKVYRFWEDNGTAYMVMPFLQGVTLKDHLRQLASPPDEAWLRSFVGPITEALGVLHERQCYHRDIAPDNVMRLDDTHKWLLLDFGAARRVIGDMTQALTVILKPGYAPVEQYAEIPGLKQGAWTDIYALAASIYFAIMGRTPPPSVGRLLNDTYVPLVQAAAGRYSPDFLAAIDRALVVRPQERTQDIGELRRDLGLDSDRPAGTAAVRPSPAGDSMPGQPGATELARQAKPIANRTAPAVSADSSTNSTPNRRKSGALMLGGGAVAVLLVALGAYRMLAPPSRGPSATVAAASPVASAPAPLVAAPVPASDPSLGVREPTAVPAVAPVPPASATGLDPLKEFDRVVVAGQAAFGVQAQARSNVLRIGQDDLAFTVNSQRDGYLTVLAYGADGTLLQLLPNTVSGTVKVRAGQTFRFPRKDGVVLNITDPPGPGRLLVMVSTWQRDYSALAPKKEGPFRLLPVGSDAAALVAAVPAGVGAPILAGRPVCPTQGSCDDGWGAAVLQVDTVR